MKLFKKQLFWTVLEIWIYDEEIDENDLENIFEIVQNFENKYSRFKKWNYLWKLNKYKSAEIDEDLKTIINIAKKSKRAFKMTFWFDYSSLFRGNLILNLWRKFREKYLNGKYFYQKLKDIFKK